MSFSKIVAGRRWRTIQPKAHSDTTHLSLLKYFCVYDSWGVKMGCCCICFCDKLKLLMWHYAAFQSGGQTLHVLQVAFFYTEMYDTAQQSIRLHYSTFIKCTLLSKVTYIIKMSVHTSCICFVTFSCVKLSRRMRKKWNNCNSNPHIVCKWHMAAWATRRSVK